MKNQPPERHSWKNSPFFNSLLIGFFQSMCLVELDQPVTHGNFVLRPGTYRLNTIKKDGRAQVTTAAGEKTPEINLAKLVAAGFRRIA